MTDEKKEPEGELPEEPYRVSTDSKTTAEAIRRFGSPLLSPADPPSPDNVFNLQPEDGSEPRGWYRASIEINVPVTGIMVGEVPKQPTRGYVPGAPPARPSKEQLWKMMDGYQERILEEFEESLRTGVISLRTQEVRAEGERHIQCPLCGWKPTKGLHWHCFCGYHWDTFDTHALCPGCSYQWKATQCLGCGRMSPHDAWYPD